MKMNRWCTGAAAFVALAFVPRLWAEEAAMKADPWYPIVSPGNACGAGLSSFGPSGL